MEKNQIFILRSNLVHTSKYDYSSIKYTNTHAKVAIKCYLHGVFLQTPKNHLKGHGCPLCAYNSNKELQSDKLSDFIFKSIKVHGDKYDY